MHENDPYEVVDYWAHDNFIQVEYKNGSIGSFDFYEFFNAYEVALGGMSRDGYTSPYSYATVYRYTLVAAYLRERRAGSPPVDPYMTEEEFHDYV
jgi:hypothetical protein